MASPSKPLVLIADDDKDVLEALSCQIQNCGYRTACAANKGELLHELARQEPDLLLLDLYFGVHDGIEVMQTLLPRHPGLAVVLLTGNGAIDSAVLAIKRGAYDYLTKPPDLPRLQVMLGHVIEERRLRERVQDLEQLVRHPSGTRPLWGESPAIKQLRDLIATIAPTDATCLILGESGTGKELVARALHEQSPRRDRPFIPVNMAALPRELAESVLFGHERGAFTGAEQAKIGCAEAADGGTLLLDEIGEMELSLQAKLLRFLQDRLVQRVGSTQERPVDVRVLAATNRDLHERVRAGQFREDLFYRLNVIPIEVPPLRQRRSDIPMLANRFLLGAAGRNGKNVHAFTDEALAVLSRYDWPGNVRQLENLIERLVILSRHEVIRADALPPEFLQPASARSAEMPRSLSRMEQVEKHALEEALERVGGRVSAAARDLGISQATAYRKIKRYELPARDTARLTGV